MSYPKTIFCDIDGVILKHQMPTEQVNSIAKELILPGVHKAFERWLKKGYKIVITTGRPDSMRELTEKQLSDCGLCYHNIIMGLNRGCRVIINDLKPDSDEETAVGISIKRDTGLTDIDI